MTVTKTKRRDPRSEATREALIEAAEQLFAVDGFDAVSIRQIGAAIGSSNNAVVAYHFGSKDALIDSIYRYRLPEIEAGRRRRFAEAEAAGKGDDIDTLLCVLWMPLMEQVNDAGQHSYGRFLAAMIRKGIRRTREILTSDFPIALDIAERISSQLSFEPGASWELRWHLATNMILDALGYIDLMAMGRSDQAMRLFADAIQMAKAALTAPPCEIARRDTLGHQV